MASFNLTAQINLQGPKNVNKVVSGIQKQLKGLNANVNLNISSNTTKQLADANKKLQKINSSLNKVTASAKSATSAVGQFASTINSIGTGNVSVKIQSASKATQQLGKNAKVALGNLKIARSEIEEFGRQSALAVRRFTAFASVTSVIYGVNNAINQALSDFVKFDRQLVRVSQVSGQAVSNLKGLQATIGQLATSFGVSSSSLAEISVTLTQAGFSIRDVQKALKALALTDVAPTFDNLNSTVEGSIALLRQFSIDASRLEASLSSINAVAAQFAVESSDIITAIQRAGGVFAAASKGVSEGTDALNEFIAVFTSVRATTRESAETIATGLRTIFTRIQRGDTIQALKAFGVELQDSEGKFVGAYEAVRRLSEGLRTLDPRDVRFTQIVEQLGGFRQIGKVIPLISKFSTAQEALKVAQQGQSSLADSAAKSQQALAIQIAQVREQFLKLVRDIAGTSTFKGLVTGALQFTSALLKIADAIKGLLPIIAALSAARGAAAIAQFAKGFKSGITRGQGFAKGGTVPGTGNTDSVPAMLTPGEFVLRKSAVKSIGTEKLHKMNKYGSGDKVKDIANTSGVSKQLARSISRNKEQPFRSGVATNANDRFTAGISYDSTSRTQVENYIKTLPKKRQASFRSRIFGKSKELKGEAFEQYLSAKKTKAARTSSISKTYPVDFHSGSFYGEAKNVQTKLNDNIFIDKLYRARVLDGSYKNLKDQTGGPPSSESGQNINLGKIKVFYSKFAKGGTAQDTVPAMLTPGEFVFSKESANRIGYGNLRKMNNRPQGFNKGGIVGYATGGGPSAVSGQAGDVRIGRNTLGDLKNLENALVQIKLPADQLTSVLTTKGTVDAKLYQSALRQVKANLAQAKASAKSSTEIAKVTALEEQLTNVRKNYASKRRRPGGKVADIAEKVTGDAGFYAAAGLAALAAAAESTNTALGSGLAGAATSLAASLALVQGVSATIGPLWGVIAAVSPGVAAGLTGMLVPLLPFAAAAAAVVAAIALVTAGFYAYYAAQKKAIELEKQKATDKLDKANDAAARAMEKFAKDASAINFQEVNRSIAEQLSAAKRFDLARSSQTAFEQQDTGFTRAITGYLPWVDSLEEATANNERRVKDSAKEIVEAYSKALQNAQQAASIQFEKGATLRDIQAGSTPELAALRENLINTALAADTAYQEQVQLAAAQGKEVNANVTAAARARVKADLFAAGGTLDLQSKVAEAARLQDALNQKSKALTQNFQLLESKMKQAMAIIDLEAQARQKGIDTIIAASQGSASIPELTDKTNAIIDNAAAATDPERAQARRSIRGNLAPILGADRAAEVSALATAAPENITKAIEDAVSNTAPGQLIGADSVKNAVDAQLAQLRAEGLSGQNAAELQGLADDMSRTIQQRIASEGANISDQRRREIIEEESKKFNETLKAMSDSAKETAKTLNNQINASLNRYAKNLEQINQLEAEAIKYKQQAINQEIENTDKISRLFDNVATKTSASTRRTGLAEVAELSGGATDAATISQNITNATNRINRLSERRDAATDPDVRKRLTDQINEQTKSLNNNRQALDRLGEVTQQTIDILLQEAESRKALQDANRDFAETLLTSGPDELKAMDEALVRANQRLNGFIPQAGANQRKRFFELLKQTGSVRQASQGVAAETRKADLQFMKQTRGVRQFRLESDFYQQNIAGGMSEEEARADASRRAQERMRRDEGRILAQMGGEAGLGALGQSIVGQAVATTFDRRNDPVMASISTTLDKEVETQKNLNETLQRLNETLAAQAGLQNERSFAKEKRARNRERAPLIRSGGGMIYAADGEYINFQPRGTDTVPAMLTPGEFVVNRKATQQNLGLLQAINGGAKGFSKGGVVYLAKGGFSARDTNKDGVIQIGVEDASGLQDVNNDGIITFAEFMAGEGANDPKAKNYIKRVSQALSRNQMPFFNPLNILANEQLVDSANIFGPINDEYQDYVSQKYAEDLEQERVLSEKLDRQKQKLDQLGPANPFEDKQKQKQRAKLNAQIKENDEKLKGITGNRNFQFAKEERTQINVQTMGEDYSKFVKEATDQNMTQEEAEKYANDKVKEKYGITTPEQIAAVNRIVRRQQTIGAITGGGLTPSDARAGHVAGLKAARTEYLRERQRLIDEGYSPIQASQMANRNFQDNYTAGRNQFWEKRAAQKTKRGGPRPDGPQMPLSPAAAGLAAQTSTESQQTQSAGQQAAKINAQFKKEENERKRKKEAKTQRKQDRKAKQRAQEQQAAQQAREEQAREAKRAQEEKNQKDILNRQEAAIAAKREKIREEIEQQKKYKEEAYGGGGFQSFFGDVVDWAMGAPNMYDNAIILLEQQDKNLAATQGMIADKRAGRETGDYTKEERDAYIENRSGINMLVQKKNEKGEVLRDEKGNIITERVDRSVSKSERAAGAGESARQKAQLQAEEQGIDAAKQTIETGINVVAMGTGSAVSAVATRTLPAAATTQVVTSTGGRLVVGGVLSGAETGILSYAEGNSAGEVVSDVAFATVAGSATTGLGDVLSAGVGAVNRRFGRRGGGAAADAVGDAVPSPSTVDELLDPMQVQAASAPNAFDPTTMSTSTNAGPINPNYVPEAGSLNSTTYAPSSTTTNASQPSLFDDPSSIFYQGPELEPITNLDRRRLFDNPTQQTINPTTQGQAGRQRGIVSESPTTTAAKRNLTSSSDVSTSPNTQGVTVDDVGGTPQYDAAQMMRDSSLWPSEIVTSTNVSNASGSTPSMRPTRRSTGRPIDMPEGPIDTGASSGNASDFTKRTLTAGAGTTVSQASNIGSNVLGPDLGVGPIDVSAGSMMGAGTTDVEAIATIARSQKPRLTPEQNREYMDMLRQGIKMEQAAVAAQRFNNGGMVYASNGALIPYRPQGTDTVPAMLTPGEFVVNRNATSKYLPVLRAINSGYNTHNQMVNHLAKGGVAGMPRYMQQGGITTGGGNNGVSVGSRIEGLEELQAATQSINQAISDGTANMNNLATTVSAASTNFANTASSINQAAENIPDSVNVAQNLRVDGIPDTLNDFSNNLLNSSVAENNKNTNKKFNDMNTKNEGSLGLPSPNDNQFLA